MSARHVATALKNWSAVRQISDKEAPQQQQQPLAAQSTTCHPTRLAAIVSWHGVAEDASLLEDPFGWVGKVGLSACMQDVHAVLEQPYHPPWHCCQGDKS